MVSSDVHLKTTVHRYIEAREWYPSNGGALFEDLCTQNTLRQESGTPAMGVLSLKISVHRYIEARYPSSGAALFEDLCTQDVYIEAREWYSIYLALPQYEHNRNIVAWQPSLACNNEDCGAYL